MKKHTMFIGLFDKDSKRQEVTTLDAYKVVANIFKSTTGGATISEAVGVYTHDNGEIVIEPSLRCEIYGATSEDVERAAEMAKRALNQEAVVIEEAETNSRYF